MKEKILHSRSVKAGPPPPPDPGDEVETPSAIAVSPVVAPIDNANIYIVVTPVDNPNTTTVNMSAGMATPVDNMNTVTSTPVDTNVAITNVATNNVAVRCNHVPTIQIFDINTMVTTPDSPLINNTQQMPTHVQVAHGQSWFTRPHGRKIKEVASQQWKVRDTFGAYMYPGSSICKSHLELWLDM
jgi:hypothetical protein